MRLAFVSIVLVLFAITPLCAAELTGTLKQINQTGKIKIGYRKDLPPMSFENEVGKPVGYSIDLCTQVVKKVENTLGREITLEFVPVTTQNRFDALTAGKIDILCGATTRTISRGKVVDFSQLTFVTGASFITLAKTDNSKGFNGKKIGVTADSTTAAALKTLLEETGVEAEVVLTKSSEEGFRALNKKKIDAFASDQVVLIGLAIASGQPKSYHVSPNLFSYEPLALALRRNDADFRLEADSVITGLYRSEKILEIYDKWFGLFAKQRSSAFQALTKINAIPE